MKLDDVTRDVLRRVGAVIREREGTPTHPNARGYKPSSPRFLPKSKDKLMARRARNRARNKRARLARRITRRAARR